MSSTDKVSVNELQPVDGVVMQGYGVASGRATDSPYPRGTITMQQPHFEALGLDLSGIFPGTLNVSIKPQKAEIIAPELTFEQVQWAPGFPPETFSFSACVVDFSETRYPGWIYYPHPETKPMHFQDASTLEVLAPAIAGLAYGSQLRLWLNPQAVQVIR